MDPAFNEIRDHKHFEEFAADYLQAYGFIVEEIPGEGPDGGRDLVVSETSRLLLGNSIKYKWLVSCKFYSRSVGPEKEQDIVGRLQQHGCNGFMAFYSTRPTEGLIRKLTGMQNTPVAQIHQFDIVAVRGTDIVGEMRSKSGLYAVAAKHMPNYFRSEIEPLIAGDEFAKGEL